MHCVRHQLSSLFGNLPTDEYDALADSIANDGFQDPSIYVLDDGADGTEANPLQIIDGWHRYMIANDLDPESVEAGNTLNFIKVESEAALSAVMGANLHRRHLTPGQRADIVVQAAKWMDRGRPAEDATAETDTETETETPPAPPAMSNKEMASIAQTSEATIKRSKTKAREEAEGGAEKEKKVKIKDHHPLSGTPKSTLIERIDDLTAKATSTEANLANAESEAQFLRDAADDSISESQQHRELRNALNENANLKVENRELKSKVEMLRRRIANITDLCTRNGIEVTFDGD